MSRLPTPAISADGHEGASIPNIEAPRAADDADLEPIEIAGHVAQSVLNTDLDAGFGTEIDIPIIETPHPAWVAGKARSPLRSASE